MTDASRNLPDSSSIRVYGARQHNLKNIDVAIPRGSFTVITGLSGSGKSSLAFDTIYAEGRRKYVESLSVHARQFLEQMQRPDVDRIEGLPPTIAIEQRTTGAGPRSTVATTTEIYDYLRVLFARTATPTCWVCGREIIKQTVSQMVEAILQQPEGRRILILAPIITKQKGNHRATIDRLIKEGYVRARINGETIVLEDAPQLSPGKKHTIEVVVDRLTVKHEIRQRLADSLELATRMGNGLVIISAETEKDKWTDLPFSSTLACPDHPDVRVPELTPQIFSFNAPLGACEECHGLGTTLEFDPELVVPDANKSLRAGAIAAWRGQGKTLTAHYNELIQQFCNRFAVLPDIPFRNIPPVKVQILLHGESDPQLSKTNQYRDRQGAVLDAVNDLRHRPSGNSGASQIDNRQSPIANPFEGVLPSLRRRYAEAKTDSARALLREFMTETPCPSCHGARLNRQALSAKIAGHSIADITRMSISKADAFFSEQSTGASPVNQYRDREGAGLVAEKEAQLGQRRNDGATSPHHHITTSPHSSPELAAITEPLLRAIRHRLRFLRQVGVDYLTLDRPSNSLSGGEFQRIRLATQIGSGLAGVCYVLDEPTIGLHPRDTRRLTEILQALAAADNTVIAVEHDEEVIAGAQYMIDIGPGAGAKGGHLVAAGPLEDVLKNPNSITARFLRGDSKVALPDERRAPDWSQAIELTGVTAHNLKNIDVQIPLGCLVAVTGVSGSGKSTLVNQVLLRALKRAIEGGGPRPLPFRELRGADLIDRVAQVDQSPIGRTPRSNPATYVGAFNLIRDLFAKTREAKIRGYGPKRFSFNVKGGRCEACEGQGLKRVSMHFLPDVYVTCSECNGTRYNRETLEIRYRGKNIADVLNMSIDEAVAFFENFSNIHRRLAALKDCGLGYITLGQASNTLSGGEAQRVKLAAELKPDPPLPLGEGRVRASSSPSIAKPQSEPGAQATGGAVPTSIANRKSTIDNLQSEPAAQATGGAVPTSIADRQSTIANPGFADMRTLYVLDEPTTGLHPADVRNLLGLLQRLVSAGNTIVVIEHNLDVIAAADWVIDLGPEGGDAGGQILASGPPETIAATETSHTGHFLRSKLSF